jgi:hypothetical protein
VGGRTEEALGDAASGHRKLRRDRRERHLPLGGGDARLEGPIGAGSGCPSLGPAVPGPPEGRADPPSPPRLPSARRRLAPVSRATPLLGSSPRRPSAFEPRSSRETSDCARPGLFTPSGEWRREVGGARESNLLALRLDLQSLPGPEGRRQPERRPRGRQGPREAHLNGDLGAQGPPRVFFGPYPATKASCGRWVFFPSSSSAARRESRRKAEKPGGWAPGPPGQVEVANQAICRRRNRNARTGSEYQEGAFGTGPGRGPQNVSRACRIMGDHRDSLDEPRRAFQVGGDSATIEQSHGPRGPDPNRVR